MNERFTRIADKVSEAMGYWQITVISVVVVLIWFSLGPFFHWSDTWQLMINTPTTIIELWIGFLLAAAANRAERRNRELLEIIQRLVQKEEQEIQQISVDIEKEEVEIQQLTVNIGMRDES